jgi:HAD superfamily hydrolase (TIGR01490 family)
VSGPRAYPDDVTRAPRTAAFFDLDKTVIARSSTLALSRPLYTGGLLNRRAVLRSTYAHFMYLISGADHDQMERMRRYLSSMVAGWDVQQVRDIVAETLVELIQPWVYREAVALIAEHHAAGRDVVIVSTSGAEVVEPIARMLGADDVIATQMSVADGRYTGGIEFYAYRENKAEATRTLAGRRGYDLDGSYAYSDSATDLPMLEAVGHPYAVNPDRTLRREAIAREWPVLDFRDPAPLRRRLTDRLTDRFAAHQPDRVPRRQGGGLIGSAAIAALVAGAVVAWAAVRRRSPYGRAAQT